MSCDLHAFLFFSVSVFFIGCLALMVSQYIEFKRHFSIRRKLQQDIVNEANKILERHKQENFK